MSRNNSGSTPTLVLTARTNLLVKRLATFNTAALITELCQFSYSPRHFDTLTNSFIDDKGIREEHQRLLDRLGDANYGARGDAIEDVICLEGTRVEVLQSINAWIRDASASEKVLWIRGMAGRGKSTIASTVAHQWKYQSASAIFHFRRGQNEGDKGLVCALARQLGGSTLVPQVKESILQSVRENQDIRQGRLREQFQTLLVRPLSGLQNTSLPILLVVDALDECADADYAVNFVNLLNQFLPSLPVNIKVLLTTRPEAPLLAALEPKPWHFQDLDSASEVYGDIAKFLQSGFLKIRERYSFSEDWPPPNDVQAIVRMSQGLFQWARTAIKYMIEGSPKDRLQDLLELPSVCKGMDDLYLQILSKAFEAATTSPQRRDIFLRILGTLVVSPHPISFETLSFLYADHPVLQKKSAEGVIQYLRLEVLVNLGSLIHIPASPTDPIQLMHTSIRDLLVDSERCGGQWYSVDLRTNHLSLAEKCFHLMGRDLKTNICNLSNLSKANSDSDIQDRVRQYVHGGLQYCCRSWSIHLIEGAPKSGLETVMTKFSHFSEQKLIGWLEIMSLIGETQACIAVTKELGVWLRVSICD